VKIFDLKVGYECNNNCIHCVITSHKERLQNNAMPTDLTFLEISSVLENASRQGVSKVVVTGGEPSIRSDLPQILEHLNGLGMHINVQSNGRRLSNPTLLKAIESIPGISFTIALHGPTAALHDQITRKQGSFVETIESIRTLVKLDKRVTLKIVISKPNAKVLSSIFALAEQEGVSGVCLAFPHGMGNALTNFREVIPSYSEIWPELEPILDRASLSTVSIILETFPPCVIGGRFQNIAELMDTPQTSVDYLHVGETVRDWNVDRVSIKTKFSQCEDCLFYAMCEGPWDEYPLIYGNKEFKPVDFSPSLGEDLLIYMSQIQRMQKALGSPGGQPK